MPLHENDVVAERFRLVRELGRGGMGSVWLAQHESLRIPCAVKFISDSGAAVRELRIRFEQEARAAAQIRSPNVVGILDHGIWQGQPYIAMEYLEGEDLAARLARDKRIGAQETAEIVTQVARGLSKAHAIGVIHRDLKPENLFLVRDEEGVTVKILDFGIAKSPAVSCNSDARTRTGTLLGTPYYMSPEQVDGTMLVDHRSDLWSVAVIAYQCMTGQLPFNSEAIGDLLMRIMERPLPIPSAVAPDLPPGFDGWWMRAAARRVGERFQSAREMAEALSAALGVAPTLTLLAEPSAALPSAPAMRAMPAATAFEPNVIGAATRISGAGQTFALTAYGASPARRRRRKMLFAAGLAISAGVGLFALSRSMRPVSSIAVSAQPSAEAATALHAIAPEPSAAPAPPPAVTSATIDAPSASASGADVGVAPAAKTPTTERPPTAAAAKDKPKRKSAGSKASGTDEPDLGF